MRIIAGKYKGRKIFAPRGQAVRPTPDMVREALFSILQNQISGGAFLDLCAGSGAIGIEALSRGAKKAVFADPARESVRALNENIESIRAENAEVLYKDAASAIKHLYTADEKFDFIYIDPPYESGLHGRILAALQTFDILCKEGVIILESNAKKDLQIGENTFIIVDERIYGKVRLTFLKARAPEAPE